MKRILLFVMSALVVLMRVGHAAGDTGMKDVLVLGPLTPSKRVAIHVDPVEHQIVSGTWSAPKAGDAITMPDGSKKTWTKVVASEDGWVRDEALGGGYVLWEVEWPRQECMLLDATGHTLVYVNGELWVGDPYQSRFSVVPVEMKQGQNEFLFLVGRGEVKASIRETSGAPMIADADRTVPDLLRGEKQDVLLSVPVLNCGGTAVRVGIRGKGPKVQTTGAVTSIPPFSIRKVGCS